MGLPAIVLLVIFQTCERLVMVLLAAALFCLLVVTRRLLVIQLVRLQWLIIVLMARWLLVRFEAIEKFVVFPADPFLLDADKLSNSRRRVTAASPPRGDLKRSTFVGSRVQEQGWA